jgi:hypothetical protein
MDYYEKYIKYKTKYLNLNKLQLIKQNGGGVKINLDEYKTIFQNLIRYVPVELGFNLLYDNDTKDISFEITKGTDSSVSLPYNIVIDIHTHPKNLKNYNKFEYHPPTQSDYVMSCISYFRGTKISIVIEKAGIWIYKPNKGLIKEIEKIQPNVRELFLDPLDEGETRRKYDISDDLHTLFDVISTNTSNNSVYLNFTDKNKINILSEAFISSYIQERIEKTGNDDEENINYFHSEALKKLDELENLSPKKKLEQLEKKSPHFHKIDFDEFIKSMPNIVTNKLGFEVKFLKWNDKFEFNIDLDEQSIKFFNQIKSRNYTLNKKNIFNSIMIGLEETYDNYIIRPSTKYFT